MLAETDIGAVFSYAGRTRAPVPQPLPTRIGGFGGAAGLAAYLRAEGMTHVVDATHPFAAQMSRNAAEACAAAGVALLALERPAWTERPGDRWQRVADLAAACSALPAYPASVFLAIGKQHLDVFSAAPQHSYLLRLVDDPQGAVPLPNARIVVDRGPFTAENDQRLFETQGITHIVAKNAGGVGAQAKLIAARTLGLRVILVDRPASPNRKTVSTPLAALTWIRDAHDGQACLGV